VAAQCDSSGRRLDDVAVLPALPTGSNTIGAVTQASGPWTQNLTQVNGSSVSLGQTTMSASLPVAIASNQSTLPTNFTDLNFFNAVSATATATSSLLSAPMLSATGDLYVTFASITGSPSGCGLQLKNADSLGNLISNGSSISVTPSNGTTASLVTSSSSLSSTDEMEIVYSCTTYPTAGTMSVDFVPQLAPNINIARWDATSLGSPTDYGTAPSGSTEVIGVNADVTNTPSVNLSQINGSTAYADPCQVNTPSAATISITANGQIITGTSGKQTYVCYMMYVTATAQNIALVEGTGTTCGTSTTGMAGGSTAATGQNWAANGGFSGGDGRSWIFKTATAADNVCLLLSGSGQTSGVVKYVQQ
jgi:hypothetical protein